MDLSSLPEPLQGSEMDVIMQDNEQAYAANATTNGVNSNGTINPQVLTSLEDLDLPDSVSPEESQGDESRATSAEEPEDRSRKHYLPTGCCYDDRMKLHANADFSLSPHHPEDPRRIAAIMTEFKQAGLVYTGPESELADILKVAPTRYMYRIPARAATAAEICTMHTAEHYEWVRALSRLSSRQLREMSSDMDAGRKSLYLGNLTFEAALLSAGGAIETCKNVVEGRVKNAIAVIRPPGHHAEHDEAMGFCLFNNVPVAAKICMMDYPNLCRKILILDWDVHHGNGIQNMYYDDPNVLYISIHVYQNGSYYPGQPDDPNIPDGGLDKVGNDLGIGKNVNIGWHDDGMGDAEYMAAFQRIVMPIAREFDPDLVIISAGFDAAAGDTLGGCFVTPPCYAHMTHMLMSLADGKVAVCLEGGYNLRAISVSALAVAKTLMGEPPERIGDIAPINSAADQVLHQVKYHQAPYWECMRPGVVSVDDVRDGIRLHDVTRGYQARVLRNHAMTPLTVQRDKISRTFEDQVLVTPSIYKAKQIIIIFHDPPELLASTPHPTTTRLPPHNAFLSDPLPTLIDTLLATTSSNPTPYGLIDISIPTYLSPPSDAPQNSTHPVPSTPSTSSEYNTALKTLACYIWDNYILTSSPPPSVLLIGIGDAYLAIKHLLTSRPDSRRRIAGVLGFVEGTLRPVKSETDEGLSRWYKDHSLIYVGRDHACWERASGAGGASGATGDGNEEGEGGGRGGELNRKVRKMRFGRCVRSEVDGRKGVKGMVDGYGDEAGEWIRERFEECGGWDEDETEGEL